MWHGEHFHALVEHDGAGLVCLADGEVHAQRHGHVVHRRWADEGQEQRAEEEGGNSIHRKWLDRPIDDERQQDAAFASCAARRLSA